MWYYKRIVENELIVFASIAHKWCHIGSVALREPICLENHLNLCVEYVLVSLLEAAGRSVWRDIDQRDQITPRGLRRL